MLVDLPTTQLPGAIGAKAVQSFAGAVGARRIATDLAKLGDKVLSPGKVGGAQYFLPDMTLVDVAVYRASKVRDAILHWSALRPQIDAALKKVNGHGLPTGYDLDLSPADWDSYDLFVLGYYWAHRSYRGKPAQPRIAHRTGEEIDGQLDIAAGLYRAGVTDATFAKVDSPPAQDYFEWETVLHGAGVYPDAMYDAAPYDDEAVVDGLIKGDLYFATIDSMEAFDIHGGAYAGAIAHAKNPADLEFAAIPRGASLALDAKNHPARESPSFSFREDWVWALPASAHATDVAYQLVRFLWRPEIHARVCEAFGTMPLHPDVVAERVSRFRLEWMSHVFQASLEQAQHGEPVPDALAAKGLGSIYAQLWTTIVARGVLPVPVDAIAAALRAPPPPRAPPTEAATAATEGTSGSDADGKAGSDADAQTEETPDAAEDWETHASFVIKDAGTSSGSAAGSAAGSGKR